MAPALGVSLSGPRSYDGAHETFPWVNPDGRKDAGPNDVDRAIGLLWKAWAMTLAVAVVIALL
jgi:adenosylcobinamide-phosphate synthase